MGNRLLTYWSLGMICMLSLFQSFQKYEEEFDPQSMVLYCIGWIVPAVSWLLAQFSNIVIIKTDQYS